MIHPSVKIHPTARIDCRQITILEGGCIGKDCIIQGQDVFIGRNFWMDEGALIGGGSCFDKVAFLKAGDFLHMGRASQLNIARGITIGDEVGIGIQTQVFTHGAYLNELEGFPVQFESVTIGSNVWLPNAWVNPGVTIGDNVVVAARSLINKDIPSGSLAGGSPAKVLKENFYPKQLSISEKNKILEQILLEIPNIKTTLLDNCLIEVGGVLINCLDYTLAGQVNDYSSIDKVLNQLRRHGIRFRYTVNDTEYKKW